MQHNSSLPLIFLILGFILNQGRRSNSYQLFLTVRLTMHFWFNHMGPEKGGGKEMNMFATFSHNVPVR